MLGKFFVNSATIGSCAWIIDFGSTDHMSFDTSFVSILKPSEQSVVLTNGIEANVLLVQVQFP